MIPRFLALLSVLCLTIGGTAAQNEADAEIPAWQLKLENLSPEKKVEYTKAIQEASRLFNQKRVFECLNAIHKAEEIFDGNPAVFNLKGACYVEFRDFAKARALFEEALTISPDNPNILFNLIEMEFVTKNWKTCKQRIDTLMAQVKDGNEAMQRLLEFKKLLCHLKLDELDEARALADKYDFLDDHPYYYYANATMAFHAGDTEKAEEWIASARRVFRSEDRLAPWQDTLIEFGYIKSFYGDALNPDSTPPQP